MPVSYIALNTPVRVKAGHKRFAGLAGVVDGHIHGESAVEHRVAFDDPKLEDPADIETSINKDQSPDARQRTIQALQRLAEVTGPYAMFAMSDLEETGPPRETPVRLAPVVPDGFGAKPAEDAKP